LQAKFDHDMPCETVSKINLVDLAGRYVFIVVFNFWQLDLVNTLTLFMLNSMIIITFLSFGNVQLCAFSPVNTITW